MKTLNRALFILMILAVFGFNQALSQDHFATLKKNYNVLAEGLIHTLNESRDALLLKSESPILRVYTIGDYSGVVDIEVNAYEQTIPLNEFGKGKYVFVVDQPRLKIVFQVLVHRDGSEFLRSETRLANGHLPAVNELEPVELSKISSLSPEIIPEANLGIADIEFNKVALNPLQEKKAYNLTDMDRTNIQSREEARRIRSEKYEDKSNIKSIKTGSQKLE